MEARWPFGGRRTAQTSGCREKPPTSFGRPRTLGTSIHRDRSARPSRLINRAEGGSPLNLLAHMTLCDHAATPGGRLYVSGGGMRLRAPTSQPWALALEVRVPWSDNNRKFPFRIDLFDTDGEPFMVDTPNGPQPLHAGGERRLTAGPGLKPARISAPSSLPCSRPSRCRPASSSNGSSRSTARRATSGESHSRRPRRRRSSSRTSPSSCRPG